jgi:hypothetical protein
MGQVIIRWSWGDSLVVTHLRRLLPNQNVTRRHRSRGRSALVAVKHCEKQKKSEKAKSVRRNEQSRRTDSACVASRAILPHRLYQPGQTRHRREVNRIFIAAANGTAFKRAELADCFSIDYSPLLGGICLGCADFLSRWRVVKNRQLFGDFAENITENNVLARNNAALSKLHLVLSLCYADASGKSQHVQGLDGGQGT